MQQYGMGSDLRVNLAGPFGSAGGAVKLLALSLPAANWKGATSPYFQQVAVSAISINSMIDLQPDEAQLERFRHEGISLFAENDGGAVTVYALGSCPREDLTMQATAVEVIA